jgi:hypothetical protein
MPVWAVGANIHFRIAFAIIAFIPRFYSCIKQTWVTRRRLDCIRVLAPRRAADAAACRAVTAVTTLQQG